MEDIELGIPQDSYPALADWIAADPDNEALIFRKFDRLSTRKLLQMQNELCVLEATLNQLELKDSRLRRSSQHWGPLTSEAQDEQNLEWERAQLTAEIQRKLTEYHQALILQSQIASLRKPPRQVIKRLRGWFMNRGKDSGYSILDDELDLITLKSPSDSDMLFRFIKNYWPLEGTKESRIRDNARYLRLRHVERIVAFISTFAAAAETTGAIYGLYFETDQSSRLAMVGIFTLVFGLSLRFLTNARRVEIFVATAAYGAVLVVFVSKNLLQPG
ncbi:hypothetical protein F5Y04DRAFT_287717 [Hypomontagnella monticulosa]|nr:hypothetical protein F5Y04DRAFT_287717 [Hypomontagnella monticulosa]